MPNTESEIYARITEKLVKELSQEFNKSIERLADEIKEQSRKNEKQMQAIIKLEQVVINLEKRMHTEPCEMVKELKKEFDNVKHESPCCNSQAIADEFKKFKNETETNIRFLKDKTEKINWTDIKTNSITAVIVGSLFLIGRMIWFAIESGYSINGQ